jgi:hypothetical protein
MAVPDKFHGNDVDCQEFLAKKTWHGLPFDFAQDRATVIHCLLLIAPERSRRIDYWYPGFCVNCPW